MDARKRLDRALQTNPATPEQALRGARVLDEPRYLTLDEGARLLRFDVTAPGRPRRAFLQFLKVHGIPVLRRGRVRLVDRRVLEAFLRVG